LGDESFEHNHYHNQVEAIVLVLTNTSTDNSTNVCMRNLNIE